MEIKAVILAGGGGVRLWPVSRKHLPKQFLSLDGGDTLLEGTVKRLSPLVSPADVLIVTGERFVSSQAGHQLTPYQVLLEPEARSTAPAIGLAAAWLKHYGKDPIMVVLPADHIIKNETAFQKLLSTAIELAAKNKLIVFGIPPTRPDTGFGYIQADPGQARDPAWSVQRFVEKPNRSDAEQYIQQGNFFWNSGIFVWKASAILEKIQKHLPEVFQVLEKITGAWISGKAIQESIDRYFCEMQKISIDYGVLEKIPASSSEQEALVMLQGDIGWSDMGNWDTVYEASSKDDANNVFYGRVVAQDCKNTLIHSSHRLITAVGLEDLCLVETADAILLVKKGETQRVRQIVEELEMDNIKEHLLSTTVQRPWGSYTVLEEKPGFKVKRVNIRPQASLSLQRHQHRSEHWLVITGTATVICDTQTYTLTQNQSITIPVKSKHKLSNDSDAPLQIIEVQVGPYLEEDDIERFED